MNISILANFWCFFFGEGKRTFGNKKQFLAERKNGRFSVVTAQTRYVVILGHFLMARTFPQSFLTMVQN